MKKVYFEAAESNLGAKKQKTSKPFLSKEVLKFIEKKPKARIEIRKDSTKDSYILHT